MNNLDYIISIVILEQKTEFDAQQILNSIRDKYNDLKQEIETLLDFISRKIQALWEANVLTSNGFSCYYVNDNYSLD